MLFALLDDVFNRLLCSAPALMLEAFLPNVETTCIVSSLGQLISRHALSLFDCDGFEEY